MTSPPAITAASPPRRVPDAADTPTSERLCARRPRTGRWRATSGGLYSGTWHGGVEMEFDNRDGVLWVVTLMVLAR